MSLLNSSNFFIMATELLRAPENHWKVTDFERFGVSKNIAALVLKALDQQDIVGREEGRRMGRGSHCVLLDPKALLKLCRDNFIEQDLRRECFVTHRNIQEVTLKLQEKGFEVFLGRLSGVPRKYQHVQDGKGDIYCLNSNIFTLATRERLIVELALYRVTQGGNVFISTPRYKKFLKHDSQQENGCKIPSLLYTYLSLKNWDYPMAQAQLEYLEKRLKDEGKSLV